MLLWASACDGASVPETPGQAPAGDDGGIVATSGETGSPDAVPDAPGVSAVDATAKDTGASTDARTSLEAASGDGATPAGGDLLAYDDMGSVTGDVASFGTPDSHNDYALAPGFGWCTECGWSLYGETAQTGQASIESTAPLGYLNLRTSGYRMLHTRDVQGRMLDVQGAFADYAVAVGGDALIGKDGTRLWLSALVRLDAALGSDPVVLTTHSDPSAWHDGEATWSVGLFTSDDWSLFSAGDPSAGSRASTGKTYAVGVTALLVVEFQFMAGGDEIALYVDPPLAKSAPATADAHLTTASSLTFRDFALGANGASVSLDEVRFGRSFASVTPTP